MLDVLSLDPHARTDAVDFLCRTTGEDPLACYQCGKCAAGCPLAKAMDLAPHQVIRALQLGHPELALDSDTLWLCVGCETCATRCPCGISLPKVMDGLRCWAAANGHPVAQGEVWRFHQSFLKSVELTGRVYEIGLIAAYNLRSGHFLSGTDLAAPLLARGKIRPWPQRVKARDEVTGIFSRAAEMQRRHAGHETGATSGGRT